MATDALQRYNDRARPRGGPKMLPPGLEGRNTLPQGAPFQGGGFAPPGLAAPALAPAPDRTTPTPVDGPTPLAAPRRSRIAPGRAGL